MKNHTISASGVIERFAADCAWASARLRRKPLERQQWVAGVADFGSRSSRASRIAHVPKCALHTQQCEVDAADRVVHCNSRELEIAHEGRKLVDSYKLRNV